MDKFTRQLTLVSLLEQHAWPLSFEGIRERLPEAYPQAEPESARRAFERDKSDILAMGVPLSTRDVPDDPSNSAYTITRKRSAVGDPGFTPAELAALRFAATAMALRQDGSDDAPDATDGLRKYGGLGGTEPSPTIVELRLDANLTALFTAILDIRPVGFTHGGRTRRVMPDRLAHIDGQWYLRCEDLDAAATRTFRLDRIAGAVLPHDDSPPVADSPAADSPAADGHGSGTTTGAVRFRPWEFGDGPRTNWARPSCPTWLQQALIQKAVLPLRMWLMASVSVHRRCYNWSRALATVLRISMRLMPRRRRKTCDR